MTSIMRSFKNLAHPICYSKEAEEATKKYRALVTQLIEHENDLFDSWVSDIEKKTMEGLDRPLLIRDPKHPKLKTLKVNFGCDTLACLKEVKHLMKEFPKRKVPKVAKQLFTRFEDFRAYNNNLDKIIDLYNYLKTDTSDKEYRLFEAEVTKIDKMLDPALSSLTWNSEDLYDYIENVRLVVGELNERVRQSQDNIIAIYKLISQWEEKALFVRSDDEVGLLNLTDRMENKSIRYIEIKEASKKITSLIRENLALFEIDLDEEGPKKAWSIYLRNIDAIVTDSLLQSVAVSLGYLLDQTDIKKKPKPLFNTKLQLSQPDVVFEPSVEREIVNNFFDMALSLVDDIMGMASLVPRIAIQKTSGTNYLETIRKHPELKRLREDYIARVEKVIQKAKDQRDKYMDFSHLWVESRKDHLYYFLNYSRQVIH